MFLALHMKINIRVRNRVAGTFLYIRVIYDIVIIEQYIYNVRKITRFMHAIVPSHQFSA